MTSTKAPARAARVVHDFKVSPHGDEYAASTYYGSHIFGCRCIKRAIAAINILLQTDKLMIKTLPSPVGNLFLLQGDALDVPHIGDSRYPEGGTFSSLVALLDHSTNEEQANLRTDLERFKLFLDVTNCCIYSFDYALLDGIKSGVITYDDDWEAQVFTFYFNYIPPKYKRL